MSKEIKRNRFGISVLCKTDGAPYLEKLGKQYEENAQAGYTFCRVHVPVVSAGTTELSPEYDLYMSGGTGIQ